MRILSEDSDKAGFLFYQRGVGDHSIFEFMPCDGNTFLGTKSAVHLDILEKIKLNQNRGIVLHRPSLLNAC
jgi:hypothetical protein